MSSTPVLHLAGAPAPIQALVERAKKATDQSMASLLSVPADLPEDDPARRLLDAMAYAALAPGKRLRPAMVIASCEALGGSISDALPAATAIELLHCYTLVHDDLPAMDDDDERRGRATVHIAFDQATAILAGDGLLTYAFRCLADLGPNCAAAVTTLANRSGAKQLLAGQALDLASGDKETPNMDQVERIHRGKTGALFAAASELGAIAASASDRAQSALGEYGMAIGVAFQHADDIDDGDFAELADAARERRLFHGQAAQRIAHDLGPSGQTLVELAQWIGGL